jgi:ABC-type transporter Mla subunit MlaD
MNRQAIVGVFTILGLIGLFAIFFVLANVGTQGRYKIGVHFKSAGALNRGALVYESGVNVGVVDSTRLLPEDFTVDVILAINNSVDIPVGSRYVIDQPLTGDTTIEIVPPPPPPRSNGVVGSGASPAALALLPREILPIDQQPQGINPPSITDLLDQGQNEVQRLDRMLAQLERAEPSLLATLQSTLINANELTKTSNERIGDLSKRFDALAGSLSVAMNAAGGNIVDLTAHLDGTVKRNSTKIDDMLGMLDQAAHSLNATADSVSSLAGNPKLRQNLIDITGGLAQGAQTLAAMAADFRNVTGNSATQAQLRDTVANIDAATQKLNSLLGTLGGHSAVYGIDRGATPPPSPSPATRGNVPGGTIQVPVSVNSPTPAELPGVLKERLAAVARNLIAVQIRVSELDSMQPGSHSSPLLTRDKGPQTDFNLIALPLGRTSLFTGANDIGARGTTTYNFVANESLGNGLHVGGGILYSRLGVMGSYQPGAFGLEGRLYDLRNPTLDAYANLKLAPGIQVFGGERDALQSGRRSVFGLQLQF